MRVYNISSLLNINTSSRFAQNMRAGLYGYASGGDIVSFKGKNYDAESVINPTNHCAYCGCKVYTEDQITGIANAMLKEKSSRLEGKVRSVLEKLSEGKNSQEISTAKRIENGDEIAFFEKFMDIADKKSYLKGEEIFEQVYGLNRTDAQNLLIKNMHPLIRTIDHVSPQNLEQENNNVDANLVEACYCCNHDLKKGSSFSEFYLMFPSIKNNMPKSKFEFAESQMLDTSQENVKQRLSAANMLKHLERLFVQRTETAANLDSIDFKIKSCNDGIQTAINDCAKGIQDKQAEIDALEAKSRELENDPEFQALLERKKIEAEIDTSEKTLAGQRDKRNRISNAINEINESLQTGKKKKSKRTPEITPEEKAEQQKKKAQLKDRLFSLDEETAAETQKYERLKAKLTALNEKFPTEDMYRVQKGNADKIYNAHVTLAKLQAAYTELCGGYDEKERQETELKEKTAGYPLSEFNDGSYEPEEKEKLERYKQLKEAVAFITAHPNGSYVKALINQSAMVQIDKEIAYLETQPVISDYNTGLEKKRTEEELKKVQTEKTELAKQKEALNGQIRTLTKQTAVMTKEEALQKSEIAAKSMKRIAEKQNWLKIPQKISALNAEITFLNSTIADLQARQTQITETYKQ